MEDHHGMGGDHEANADAMNGGGPGMGGMGTYDKDHHDAGTYNWDKGGMGLPPEEIKKRKEEEEKKRKAAEE